MPSRPAGEVKSPVRKLDEYEQVRILRCTFPPGVGHERHAHPGGDFGYVLSSGKTQVTDAKGTEVVEDKAGSAAL
jgi:quercetin dioxygenase-like cupin family protein